MESHAAEDVRDILNYLTVKVYLRLKIATTGTDNGGSSNITVTWDPAMSTAAHEPRRVGPRRAESPSGSKVTPRRNASETGELHGARYDSEELPVLIRLPNLRELGAVETPVASSSRKKQHRIDPPSASKRNTSNREESKTSKKSFQQQAGDKKLVIAGITVGVLVVVTLFAFNSSDPTPPADQDNWANQDREVLVEVPGNSLPAANNPASLSPPPDFVYEAPGAKKAQVASDESERDSLRVPMIPITPPAQQQSETTAMSSKPRPVNAWPTDETMGAQTPARSTPVNLWPGESLSRDPDAHEYPLTDSPSQGDYRSSMYPSAAEPYRMGKLDSDRSLANQGSQSSILNGNIAIPDTKSLR